MTKLIREELMEQGCTEKRNTRGTLYFENLTGEVVAKECSKCSKVIALEGFCKHKTSLGGRMSTCKACDCERTRKYREANPEKARESVRKYREDNSEKIRESVRKYYEANSEKVRKSVRNYREVNPEKMREMDRKYRRNNLEKKRERVRNWQAANLVRCALNTQRRRARKATLPDTLTIKQQSVIASHFDGGCAVTGSSDYHMDHVIPLACGHGGTIYRNMIPLRADLNTSKKDRNIFEWFEVNKERHSMEQTKFDTLIAYLAEVNEMSTKEYRAYVDWCFDNPRTIDDLTTEGETV